MFIRALLRTYTVRMELTEHSHPVELHEGGQRSLRDMQSLNVCRMHLRVTRMSEIASAEGARLGSDVLKGIGSGSTSLKQGGRARLDHWLRTGHFRAKSLGQPYLRITLGLWTPMLDLHESTTLVSAQTVFREVFRWLPGGSCELYEEGKDDSPVTLSGFSITVAKATDTLSFDSGNGKETLTQQNHSPRQDVVSALSMRCSIARSCPTSVTPLRSLPRRNSFICHALLVLFMEVPFRRSTRSYQSVKGMSPGFLSSCLPLRRNGVLYCCYYAFACRG
jgi:hypothetical protein